MGWECGKSFGRFFGLEEFLLGVYLGSLLSVTRFLVIFGWLLEDCANRTRLVTHILLAMYLCVYRKTISSLLLSAFFLVSIAMSGPEMGFTVLYIYTKAPLGKYLGIY